MKDIIIKKETMIIKNDKKIDSVYNLDMGVSS